MLDDSIELTVIYIYPNYLKNQVEIDVPENFAIKLEFNNLVH